MPLSLAIPALILGLILGFVFTFGMQYWNRRTEKADCPIMETQFLSYHEIRQTRNPLIINEIRINCANGKHYFIDGVSLNDTLTDAISDLRPYEPITLRLHPNSSKIVEMTARGITLIAFDETIEKLEGEATGFLFIGLFCYMIALIGLYYIIYHVREYQKNK